MHTSLDYNLLFCRYKKIRDVSKRIHQLMAENYRLFFNIKVPELEVVEEETNGKGRLEEEENANGEYEDELGKEEDFENKVHEEDKLREVAADEGLVGVEKESLGAMHNNGVPVMVAPSSTKWLSPQLSALTGTEVEPKPDTAQKSELAVYIQLLRPTEEEKCWEEVEPEFQSEIESEVGTMWSGNRELDKYRVGINYWSTLALPT
jgi:hypothetical protein